MSSIRIPLPVSLVLAVVNILLLAQPAFAHARMVRSAPVKGAEVSVAPSQIDLWFNELLEPAFNSVEIYSAKEVDSPHHTILSKEKPALDPKDRTHLILKTEPLPPGEYAIEWRVLSRDGHSAPGRITFRITPR